MTVDPASTRANRINSDSLDWSYIGILLYGWASICEARASACVSRYSRMLVSLPSRTVMAKTQSSSHVLFVALIFPLAKPTTRTRSPWRYELPGFHKRGLHGFRLRLYQVRQPRVSVARPGQRPVLPRDDPLDVFGDQ